MVIFTHRIIARSFLRIHRVWTRVYIATLFWYTNFCLEIIRIIKQQIYFQLQCYTDEFPSITSFTGDITHISQNIINLPVRINIPHLLESLKVKHDRELEEFLRGEIHCQNFINQDSTFLQPSIIHAPRQKGMKTPPEGNTTEILPIETTENIPIREQETDL